MNPEKTVLVTGASGFVGRQCLAPLQALGWQVHALARQPLLSSCNASITWHAADLLDPDTPAALLTRIRPQAILHTAWYAEPGLFWHAPENALWLNASQRLVEQAAAQGVRRFVGVGSCAEYDWQAQALTQGPVAEHASCRPHTAYGQAKLALLNHLHALSDRTGGHPQDGGMQCTWARLFLLFGPHEHPARFVPSVITALLQQQPARCTSGRCIRDVWDVRDVGMALAALVALDADDWHRSCSPAETVSVINVASGRAQALADLAQEIAQRLGRSDLLQLGALPDRPDDPPYLVADTTKLNTVLSALRLAPAPSQTVRLAETIVWWQQNLQRI